MKYVLFFVFSAWFALSPFAAQAALLNAGDVVTITAKETIAENVYAAGESVDIRTAVDGDIFVAGSNVSVNAPVRDDAFLAGAKISVQSAIQEDLRAAGADVTIDAPVSGEVLIAGANIYLSKDTVIDGSAYLAGGLVVIDGTLNGPVTIEAGEVLINGTLNKEVIIQAEYITFNPTAVVNGDLHYTSTKEARVEDGATIAGTFVFTQVDDLHHDLNIDIRDLFTGFMSAFGALKLLKTVIYLVSVLVFMLIFGKKIEPAVHGALRSPKDFGLHVFYGFAGVVLPVFAIGILLLTVAGLGLSVTLTSVWVAMLLVARWMAAPIAGALIWLLIEKKPRVQWYTALVGGLVLSIFALVPLVGWIAVIVFYLAGMGALTYAAAHWLDT